MLEVKTPQMALRKISNIFFNHSRIKEKIVLEGKVWY